MDTVSQPRQLTLIALYMYLLRPGPGPDEEGRGRAPPHGGRRVGGRLSTCVLSKLDVPRPWCPPQARSRHCASARHGALEID